MLLPGTGDAGTGDRSRGTEERHCSVALIEGCGVQNIQRDVHVGKGGDTTNNQNC